MVDEEAFAIVVAIQQPADNAVRVVGASRTGGGGKKVHAVYLHTMLAVVLGQQVDIRLTEDHEQADLAAWPARVSTQLAVNSPFGFIGSPLSTHPLEHASGSKR